MGLKTFQLHTQCVILIYTLFRATLVILLQEKRCLAYKTLIVISMIGVYPTAEIIYSYKSMEIYIPNDCFLPLYVQVYLIY